MPYLRRAVELMLRQQRAGDVLGASEQTLERLEAGVALLDDTGSVLHLNAAARALFSADRGLRLTRQRISATSAREARLLDEAWRQLVAAGRPQEVLVLQPAGNGRQALAVVVTLSRTPPGSPLGEACGARYVVSFSPLSRSGMPEPAQLMRLFELTPAEARLAQSLAASRSLNEAARDAGVKPSTVRSQLLAVLAKTGAKRQQELVALLARVPGSGGSALHQLVEDRRGSDG